MSDTSILKKYVVDGKEYSTGYTAIEAQVMEDVEQRLNQFQPSGLSSAIAPDEEDLTTESRGFTNHVVLGPSYFTDFVDEDTIVIEITSVAQVGGVMTVTYLDDKKTGITELYKVGKSIQTTDTSVTIAADEYDLQTLKEFGIEIGGTDYTVTSVKKNGTNQIYGGPTVISTEYKVIKNKDKQYSPDAFSGKGRVILRKNVVSGMNILEQSAISMDSTIYIIQYDFNLNGQEIVVPLGSVLDFRGGSLNNGTIVLNKTEIWPNYDHLTKGTNLEVEGVPAAGTVRLSTGGIAPSTVMPNPDSSVQLTTSDDKTITRIFIQNADPDADQIVFSGIKVDMSGVIVDGADEYAVRSNTGGSDMVFGDGTTVIDKETGRIDMSLMQAIAPDTWTYNEDTGVGTLRVEEAYENGAYVDIPEDEHDEAHYLQMNFNEKARVHVVVDYTDGSQTNHTMTHYDYKDNVRLHEHKVMNKVTIQGTRTKVIIDDTSFLYRIYQQFEDEIITDASGFIYTVDPSTMDIIKTNPETQEQEIVDPSSLIGKIEEHQYVHIKNLHVVYPESEVVDDNGNVDLEKVTRVDKQNEHLIYDPSNGTLTYRCNKATDTGIYVDIPTDEEIHAKNITVNMVGMSKVKVSAEYLGYHGGHCQIFDGDDWRGVPKYINVDDSYFELKF